MLSPFGLHGLAPSLAGGFPAGMGGELRAENPASQVVLYPHLTASHCRYN